MKDDLFLLEQKDTEHQSISLKKQWIDKINEEARVKNKIPILAINMAGMQLFVISEFDFVNYKELLEQQNNAN